MIEIISNTSRIASDIIFEATSPRSPHLSSSSLRSNPSEDQRSFISERASWSQKFLPREQLTSNTQRRDDRLSLSCHETGSSDIETDHTDSSYICLTPSSSQQSQTAIDRYHVIVDLETSLPPLTSQHYLFTCKEPVHTPDYCYPSKIANADLYDDHGGETDHPIFPISSPPRFPHRASTPQRDEPASAVSSRTHTLQDHTHQLQAPFQRWLLSTDGSDITPAEIFLQQEGRRGRKCHI